MSTHRISPSFYVPGIFRSPSNRSTTRGARTMTATENNTAPAYVGWSFLASKRWLGYYALIIVFSIACVLLGNWQFDRRAEARAEIDRIDTNFNAQTIPLDEALPTLESFDIDANKWHPVTVNGNYVGDPFLARNRAAPQGVGSLLIHPFQLQDGTLFFVDRGWVDVNAADGIPEVLPMPASTNMTITVRLRESETELAGRTNEGRTLGSLDLGVLAEEFDGPAYTGAYGQIIDEPLPGETGLLPSKPERDEGPHLSYALQWYVFILIALGGAWYAATLEHRSLNAEDPEHRRKMKNKEAARKKRQKRPTDAEEEDALLDGQ